MLPVTCGRTAGGLYAVVRQYVRPEGTLFFLWSADILFMYADRVVAHHQGPRPGGGRPPLRYRARAYPAQRRSEYLKAEEDVQRLIQGGGQGGG